VANNITQGIIQGSEIVPTFYILIKVL